MFVLNMVGFFGNYVCCLVSCVIVYKKRNIIVFVMDWDMNV